MPADIAIVIAAFNRPHSLKRLLDSIARADYSGYSNVPLIISIDYSGNDDCYRVSEAFDWRFGEKKIIQHPGNLKLKKHILQCGDLTGQYDGIIMLEDDLTVSPQFYDYAQKAFAYYEDEPAVAGIALYHYRYNEFAYCPFEPFADGFDTFFLQVPCSWGQLWTRRQWQSFKQFLAEDKEEAEDLFMPAEALKWPRQSSWKRIFFKYIVSANKYFVYPRVSLTTNFGDIGAHYTAEVLIWQSPLLYGRKEYAFAGFSSSGCIYDAFFELTEKGYQRLSGQMISISFDINGSKPLHQIKTTHLVSAKYCNQPEKKFLPALYPYECNVLQDITAGEASPHFFALGKTADFEDRLVFHRLNTDLQRTFFNAGVINHAARAEVFQSADYRIGNFMLKPFRLVKRIAQKLFK